MPIFEYKCLACGHQLEQLVPTATAKPKACPDCGSEDLKKQFSSFSASVKQGGPSSDGCSLASECPSGSCCTGGSCPF
ncbi:MAG: zinc ribbon domain-containing protein [Candidatus Pacebacteria bacterium]|nr:zinc ribbon domain-containing protein [Candidatus Paceibacterota bacterium]